MALVKIRSSRRVDRNKVILVSLFYVLETIGRSVFAMVNIPSLLVLLAETYFHIEDVWTIASVPSIGR